jgi:outer membrane protein OmpA-like peptidoglycan-associated protein
MFCEFRFFRDLKPTCPQPMRETIRGFSRYTETVESLPCVERSKVDDVAKYIFASFRPGCVPILSIKLVGHADTDLEKGNAFEQDISLKRASNVEAYLRAKIETLSKDFKAAPSAPVPTDIRWSHLAVGATQPASENAGKNPNALSEADRKLNRRV